MAGFLTIHAKAKGADVDLLEGHAWIEYHKAGEPRSKSYGTWPAPDLRGGGLRENLERDRNCVGDVRRQVWLTDEQEKKLFARIDQYKAMGRNGWAFSNPCSGFASDAWQAATGEYLNSRTNGVISNPSCLKGAISAANHGLSAAPSTRVVATLGRAVGAAVANPVGMKVSVIADKGILKVAEKQTPAAPQRRSRNNGMQP